MKLLDEDQLMELLRSMTIEELRNVRRSVLKNLALAMRDKEDGPIHRYGSPQLRVIRGGL